MRLATAVIGLALMVLGVCLAGAAQEEQEALGQRAKEFWEARVKGDWAVLYHYLPTGEREKLTKTSMWPGVRKMRHFAICLTSSEGFRARAALGWVEVRYAVQIPRYPELAAKELQIWQLWRKVDGSWEPAPKQDSQEVPSRPQLRNTAEEPLLAKRVDGFWQAKEMQDWGALRIL